MDYIKRAKSFRTKKCLGQNFLIDENAICKIIEEASLSKDETILEIGSGIGFVTEQLAEKAKEVIAIEVDDDAINELSKLSYDNIKILKNDILKTDISTLTKEPVKIVANIPYYITSPILAHLLGEMDDFENKNRKSIKEIILMVQYEVARRIVADEKSPNKEYGTLSVLCNYWAKTSFIQKVPAKSFWPAPKVDSAIIKLEIRKNPLVQAKNAGLFRKVVKACFGTRRKTIKNSLAMAGFEKEIINKALLTLSIDPKRRGETLSIQEISNLSDNLINPL